jgi:glucosamine-6-phosphate deaminase
MENGMIKQLTKEKLDVKVYASRKEMGNAAGREIAETMRKLLAEREEIHMIFAAAPSQNETLAALVAEPDIDWTRVNAYHMDEYVGLSGDSPQSFSTYLREHIFGLVPFKSVNCICGAADAEEECAGTGNCLRTIPSISSASASAKTVISPSTIRGSPILTIP